MLPKPKAAFILSPFKILVTKMRILASSFVLAKLDWVGGGSYPAVEACG
jgi:hypothetical protein